MWTLPTGHCRPRQPGLVIAALVALLQSIAEPVTAADSAVPGETTDFELLPEEFRVSYAYAAVMGTGRYRINGRTISQLQLPFRLTQRPVTEDESGLVWQLPVSVGYDAITDNEWLDTVFDENPVTLTFLPGLQLLKPLNEVWTLKPQAQLGVTRDLARDKTIALASTGVQARATWNLEPSLQFIWGLGAHVVGEYQLEDSYSDGFSILETAVALRRETGFRFLERATSIGAYIHVQHFTPLWDVTDTPIGESDVRDLVEFGVSLGLTKPRKLLGMPITRVRVGYKSGSGLDGWTVGGDFPI